jgi:hypothetical protein
VNDKVKAGAWSDAFLIDGFERRSVYRAPRKPVASTSFQRYRGIHVRIGRPDPSGDQYRGNNRQDRRPTNSVKTVQDSGNRQGHLSRTKISGVPPRGFPVQFTRGGKRMDKQDGSSTGSNGGEELIPRPPDDDDLVPLKTTKNLFSSQWHRRGWPETSLETISLITTLPDPPRLSQTRRSEI